MTDTRTPSAPAQDPERRPKAVTAWLGALAALLGVATAALTFMTVVQGRQKEEAQDRAQELTRAVQGLQQQVGSLSDQIRAMGGTPGTTPTATPSATPTPSTSPTQGANMTEPAVWHQGTLSITKSSEMADLDARQNDPQWGRLARYTNADLGSITAGGSLDFKYTEHVVVQGSADYSKCSTTTDYVKQNESVGTLQPGYTVCILTDQQRFATMKVKSSSPSLITFDITVWDKAS